MPKQALINYAGSSWASRGEARNLRGSMNLDFLTRLSGTRFFSPVGDGFLPMLLSVRLLLTRNTAQVYSLLRKARVRHAPARVSALRAVVTPPSVAHARQAGAASDVVCCVEEALVPAGANTARFAWARSDWRHLCHYIVREGRGRCACV